MDVTSTLGNRRVSNQSDIYFDGLISTYGIQFEWYGASLQLPATFWGRDKRKRHVYMQESYIQVTELDLRKYLTQVKYGIVTFGQYAVLITPDTITISMDSEYITRWYDEWFGFNVW